MEVSYDGKTIVKEKRALIASSSTYAMLFGSGSKSEYAAFENKIKQ